MAAEVGENAVTHEFIQGSAILKNHCDHGLEIFVEVGNQLFGIHGLRHFSKASYIGHKNGDMATATFRAFLGDLSGDSGGEIPCQSASRLFLEMDFVYEMVLKIHGHNADSTSKDDYQNIGGDKLQPELKQRFHVGDQTDAGESYGGDGKPSKCQDGNHEDTQNKSQSDAHGSKVPAGL